MPGWLAPRRSWLWLPVQLASVAVLVGCGAEHAAQIDPGPEPPNAAVGGAAPAVMSGVAGKSPSRVETEPLPTPTPSVTPQPLTFVEPFARCQGSDVTLLAEGQSGGGMALAVDEARVYYGTRHGVMSVPIEGGTPEPFAYAGLPVQIVVDADAVYFSDQGIIRVDKASGQVTLLADRSTLGVAVRGPDVYFSTWAALRTSIQHWSDGVLRTVVEFNSEEYVPRLIAQGDELFYAPLASVGSGLPVTRYGLSDDSFQPLAKVDVARSFAVAEGYLYYTEESTRSVKRVATAGGEPSTLGEFAGYPVAIAADETHVFFTLHELDQNSHQYSGRVIRMSVDGASPCEIGSFDGYGAAMTLDDRYVYWQTSGSAESATAVVARALK